MIEAIAHQLEFIQLEPIVRIVRLANGARVMPVGSLSKVPTLIGGNFFLLNYMVIRPDRSSTYQVLIGRPWLYGAKVTIDWEKKEFRFENQPIIVSWAKVEHEGETTHINEEYDSDFSNESKVDDAYTVNSGEVLQEDHPCANNNLRSSIIPCRPGAE